MGKPFHLKENRSPNRKIERRKIREAVKQYMMGSNFIIPAAVLKRMVLEGTYLDPEVATEYLEAFYRYQVQRIQTSLGLIKSDTDDIFTVPQKTRNAWALRGAKRKHRKVAAQNTAKAREEDRLHKASIGMSGLSQIEAEKRDRREIQLLLEASA